MNMSFVGCIGNLMAGSGLEDILGSAFGGVPKMLTGKNFPNNVRALRMVVEEILRPIICTTSSCDELMEDLEARSARSKTVKLWVDNLIKPVLIMMIFVRAEREGDWLLHLWSVEAMLSYFYAAKHINYARYGLLYLREMQRLPDDIQLKFLKGEHVTSHTAGLWNGMWSDMFIETTFMRYGHGPSGIIGNTLNPQSVKRWAMSLHTCSQLINDIATVIEKNPKGPKIVHKEESESRIKYDTHDRLKLREKLITCIDPLDPNSHPNGDLMNVVTGKLSPSCVNAHDSVTIGKKEMAKFESSWPEGFYSPISSKVMCMNCTINTFFCIAELCNITWYS